MGKNVYKNKMAFLLLAAMGLPSVFAQEADDGFVVPLNEDFSNAVVISAPAASGGGASSGKQGLFF